MRVRLKTSFGLLSDSFGVRARACVQVRKLALAVAVTVARARACVRVCVRVCV